LEESVVVALSLAVVLDLRFLGLGRGAAACDGVFRATFDLVVVVSAGLARLRDRCAVGSMIAPDVSPASRASVVRFRFEACPAWISLALMHLL